MLSLFWGTYEVRNIISLLSDMTSGENIIYTAWIKRPSSTVLIEAQEVLLIWVFHDLCDCFLIAEIQLFFNDESTQCDTDNIVRLSTTNDKPQYFSSIMTYGTISARTTHRLVTSISQSIRKNVWQIFSCFSRTHVFATSDYPHSCEIFFISFSSFICIYY